MAILEFQMVQYYIESVAMMFRARGWVHKTETNTKTQRVC